MSAEYLQAVQGLVIRVARGCSFFWGALSSPRIPVGSCFQRLTIWALQRGLGGWWGDPRYV